MAQNTHLSGVPQGVFPMEGHCPLLRFAYHLGGDAPPLWAIGVNRLVPGGWKRGSTSNPTRTHPARGRDSVN